MRNEEKHSTGKEKRDPKKGTLTFFHLRKTGKKACEAKKKTYTFFHWLLGFYVDSILFS